MKLGLVTMAAVLASLGGASADPVLYVAKDADSAVYIFGTVHSLRPETDWRTAAVFAALERSHALWLETDIDGTDGAGDVVEVLGRSPDRPLSDRLSGSELEAVANLSLKLGIAFSRLDGMRPWLASVTLGAAAMRRDGFTAPGVDLSLARDAMAHGLSVAGLDPTDAPVRLFAGLSPDVEAALLRSVVADLTHATPSHVDLVSAWLRGDTDRLERIGLQPLRNADERLYEAMIAGRTRRWLPAVERLMLGAGSHFVAVGVLHVVGPDGLPRLLEDRGYAVERIEEPG